MSNFGELKDKINDWSADDEDLNFSDNYILKCDELGNNLESINKYLSLIKLDYFNSLNTLKNISIKKFVEHIVDNDARPVGDSLNVSNRIRSNAIILSKEEREANLLGKFKSSISKSLENLNIKNMLDIRVDPEKESIIDDDNVSVSSSKYFANNMNKGYKNMKLPFIIGTQEFFRHEYLGVYQGDNLISDAAVNITTTNENISYERRATTLIEDLNLDSNRMNFVNGEIKNNTENNMNIPSIPSVPSKQNATPGVPPVPKVGIPIPPALNLLQQKKTNQTNIQQNTESISKIPEINVPQFANEKEIKSDILVQNNNNANLRSKDLEDKQQSNAVESFKDTLNKMFNNNTTGRNVPNNLNNDNTIQQPLISNRADNPLVEPSKQIKLDNFIRRPTIFDDVEDDEDEDATGLFKRGVNKRHMPKSSIFDGIIPQNNPQTTTNSDSNNNTKNLSNDITSNTFNPTQIKERESLQSFSRESTASIYLQLNTNNTKVPVSQGSNNNLSNLIENKNKNLEKAKTNLLKIFDDDEEIEDKEKNVLISTKINEKTTDLNKKMSLLLDNKIETSQVNNFKQNPPNTNINKPYPNPIQDINTGIKSNLSNNLSNSNNNLNNTATNKSSIRRSIFMEEEDDENIIKPPKKEEKLADKKVVIKSDPLSNILNSSQTTKPLIIQETKQEQANKIDPFKNKGYDDISNSLKDINFSMVPSSNKIPEIKPNPVITEVKKKIIEEEEIFKVKKEDTSFKENESTKNLKNADYNSEFKSNLSKTSENNNVDPKDVSSLETAEKKKFEFEDAFVERRDTSLKKNAIKMSDRFSDISNKLGEKLNFNPMMRPNPLEDPSRISKLEFTDNRNSTADNDYEKIVSEKTTVVNKKKPKMRMFNSNMSELNKLSIASERKDPDENKKQECPFDEIKERVVEEKISEEKFKDKEKVREINNFLNTFENENNDKSNNLLIMNISPKFQPAKSKFDFDSIVEKEDDDVPNTKISLNTRTETTKLKPSIFDFDDSEVIDNTPKQSIGFGKNKLEDTNSNKKPVEKKIKFLFEDE